MSTHFTTLRNIAQYLVKFRGNSPVGDFGCLSLLVHVQVLLVSCPFEGGARDALSDLLVPHPRFCVRAELLAFAHFEAVHLRLQSDKLDNWVALCLVLEEANLSFVGVVWGAEVAGMIRRDFAKVEQAPNLRRVQQLAVQVTREEL